MDRILAVREAAAVVSRSRNLRPPRNGTRRSLLPSAALLALACSLLAGCGGGAAGSAGKSITLYSGQHPQTTQALVNAFEQKTGIDVNIRPNDEDTLADEIVTEGSHSPADVFFTENSPPLEHLQQQGLLAQVDPATLARTPAKYNSPQGDWVGVSARVSVLIYNPALISASQLPTGIRQLAEPKYRGKLAIAPSETDFQSVVTSVLHADGKAATLSWLKSVKANAGGHVYPDNETIAADVNSGTVAFGVINQYYWYRLRAQIGADRIHSKITHFAAHDPGYVIDVSGAAVLKSSKNQAAAQKFLAFLVSKQGQEIIGNPAKSISFEYPIASGVTTLAPETPLAQLQPYPITVGELGDGLTAINILREAGLL
jgi:iron(III) transport system substrate-binding protein